MVVQGGSRTETVRKPASLASQVPGKLILVGESSLRRALQQYLLHYHEGRNHQGKENRILFLFRRRQEGTREQCGVENDWAAC